jgi:DNA-binding IclR family transcriptional regulator
MDAEAKHPVRTTQKSLELVERLKEHGPSRIADLADELELGKSAIHNHLSTLRESGYVTKEDEVYALSLKFLDVGGHVRRELDLYETGEPEVRKLAMETGELSNLLAVENGEGIYLIRAKGEQAVDLDTYAGMRTPLHSTALGKAVLAFNDESFVQRVIDRHGLPAITDRTITDRGTLFDALETIQERGYAIDQGERIDGLCCVAAPIKTDEDTAIGAISVSAPASRISEDRLHGELFEQVTAAANVVELNLRF